MGWRLQRPSRRAIPLDKAAIARWKKRTWPALKKVLKEGRTVIFANESGLPEYSSVVRT
jgi:hypothetical protein